MAFFNRLAELNTLKRSLSSKQAELVIVYGRRGSGKSELLIQAINDHYALYYQATTELLPQQLVDLTNELRRVADQQGVALVGHFASLADLFAAMTSLAQSTPHQPFVVVIDEFPYLAEADPATETVMPEMVGCNVSHYPQSQGLFGWLTCLMDARAHFERTWAATE